LWSVCGNEYSNRTNRKENISVIIYAELCADLYIEMDFE
jgi:hypothetical protein